MSSARFGGSIHGAGFGAAIADAGDPAELPQKEPRLDDPIFALLVDLHLSNPESQRERSALLGERWELNQRTQKFLLRERETARATLLEAHEAKKRECAAQLKVIDDLKTRIGELQQDLMRAKKTTAEAVGDVRTAE